jgi:hypothetical protein
MKTTEQELQELQEKFEEKRKEILVKQAVIDSLPEGLKEPYLVTSLNRSRPWVSYKVKTLTEAVEILRQLGPLETVSARESGCLAINPDGEHGKHYADVEPRWEVTDCVEMQQHGGKGFYTAELKAWAVSPKVYVHVEIEQFPYNFRAHMQATYNKYGEPVTANFREPEILRGHYSQRVKFGSRDAFDLRYYFTGIDHIADVARLAD